jgi:hypothetical protein
MIRMPLQPRLLAIALALAVPAIAQPADPAGNADCKAEEAAIERNIELARSKGQMLRRQQLAEALATLQARCRTLDPAQSRAARIEALEQVIRDLRQELNRAEEQLRNLKN